MLYHLSRPLHLQRLKSQHHGKSSWECPPPLISPARGNCSGGYHAFIPFLSLRPLASRPRGYGFLSGSVLSSLSTLALMFLPFTPHFFCDASRLAFCTVGNPPSSVNTRSLVSDYRWCSCPGGPALWYCTLSWVAGLVRSAFEKLWPCLHPPCSYFSVDWRAFLLPLPTRQIRLHRTATSFFSWHLICPFGWHPTAPHDSWYLHCWVALLARWLPSPSSSAPAIYSTVANLALGYTVSWYSTTSLAHAKVRSVADFPGSPPMITPCPKAA